MSTIQPAGQSTILQVDLVTPGKLLLSAEAFSVTIPGQEGYFGVLPGHSPFLSLLRPGDLTVEGFDQNWQFVISAGYAEVLPDRVTILVDEVIAFDQIVHTEAKQQVQALTAQMKSLSPEDPDYPAQQRQLDFAMACEEASRKR